MRTLRLLLYLAERRGEVVSLDDLLKHVWSDVIVTPASVYQAIASLRRVLGDDARQPTYIATVPRLGYRMVATVNPCLSSPEPPASAPLVAPTKTEGARVRRRIVWALGALCVAVGIGFWFSRTQAQHERSLSKLGTQAPQKSVAVLPFLDLTEKVAEEEFADGLTEEVIDRLNTIPDLHVPPPTSSFYFKNKRRTVAEIANALHVAYVVDGSTRRSGSALRVAVRLIRAENGAVVWSETYDRPWGDMLAVQDDIAGKVAKAVAGWIDSKRNSR